MENVYLTRDGLEKLRRELSRMVNEVRPEATRQLAAAREHGDLSENAEYDAARENLADIDRRINILHRQLTKVHIVDESQLEADIVRVFSRVTLEDISRGKTLEYTLVDPVQADPVKKMISLQSPIGKALLGKRVGDEVEIVVPSGTVRLKVLAVERSRGL